MNQGNKNILFTIRMAIAALVIICVPKAAFADVDYKCLNACANDGIITPVCMNKCSYGAEKSSDLSDKKIRQDPHNQFSNIPSDRLKGENNNSSTKDYTCLPKCLKEKSQYKFCEEKCAAENTKQATTKKPTQR